MQSTVEDFFEMSGLPGVVGAIDDTYIHICKLEFDPEDYYYFKTGGYNIEMHGIVDRHRRFVDIVVNMPGSTYDSKVLCRSCVYH